MLKIFNLKRSNLELAADEVVSLTKTESELYGNYLICEDNLGIDLSKRLGFTNKILKYLFACSADEVREMVERFDWKSETAGTFCVRATSMERELANIIYHKLGEQRVDLDSPDTQFEFYFTEGRVIAGRLLDMVEKSYLRRKAHMRPEMHPSSLDPGLARACINLSGLEHGTILDPFCGSGGILIEAGLMGFRITGYDIDPAQIKRARTNLEHYRIKDFLLVEGDAMHISEKYDAIITDLPYGKGTKAGQLDILYSTFLGNARRMTDKAVIIFPDFIDYRRLVESKGWKIDKLYNIYVHRSLTRCVTRLARHSAA